ncbi:MAG TPA: hypothetical protein DCW90_00860, partial [Lachnospiraceae bacterium]|nr:hypothetical protein [Lachnospiraceae bacterium]
AHERVRKSVAKKQRHPLGAAKCKFLLENLSREGVRNSHFVFPNPYLHSFLYVGTIREEKRQR